MPATRVSKLTQTCKASPSQWEGLTDDGQFIYVRYPRLVWLPSRHADAPGAGERL
jgi:hypothetical protein